MDDKYAQTVERLFERHRSVQTAGFSSDAYKPGLGQMFDYAAFLGDPQLRWRGVHVAGTNGKGSVCSMLAAALAACGGRLIVLGRRYFGAEQVPQGTRDAYG